MTFGSLSDYLAREARSEDLVVTGVDPQGLLFGASRDVNTGDLVMHPGRPALIVPTVAGKLKLDRVLVGWKDTREMRCAVFDALPFLKEAAHVAVVEIAAEDELATARTRLPEVVAWLKRHDVVAQSVASLSTGDDAEKGTLNLHGEPMGQLADELYLAACGRGKFMDYFESLCLRGP